MKRGKVYFILIVIIVTLILFFAFNDGTNQEKFQNKYSDENIQRDINVLNQVDDKVNCVEKTIYKYSPVNLEKTKVVVPFGLMAGNHVTPVDHQYFQNFNNLEPNIEVYSVDGGIVKNIQSMTGRYYDPGQNKEIEVTDYRLTIDHPCEISSIYIHVAKLSEKLSKFAPEKDSYTTVNVEVNAGEIIGWYTSNVDFNLVDNNFLLKGFVNPEYYKSESWKVHVPPTFDYFTEDIKNKMIEKSLRSVEPFEGKFDHDIDGKLIGNWFEENTNFYEGLNRENYWETHISISPDYIDPTYFIISLGNYEGRPAQFGTKTNSPFPSDVSTESGIIKYELTSYQYYVDNILWDRKSVAKGIKAKSSESQVEGTVLFQLLEDRKLKVEIFPRKKGSEVNGFTINAKIYER